MMDSEAHAVRREPTGDYERSGIEEKISVAKSITTSTLLSLYSRSKARIIELQSPNT